MIALLHRRTFTSAPVWDTRPRGAPGISARPGGAWKRCCMDRRRLETKKTLDDCMDKMLKPTTGTRFDFGPLAGEYENWYSTPAGQEYDLVQRQDVLKLLRTDTARGRLLDVGCGTGHWSRFFQSRGYKVQGIDISEGMIREAMSVAPECAFGIADARALPFRAASFDVVACMATLEFIIAPGTAVREMARCVKPGGSLIIGTLNRLSELNRDRLSRGEQPYASGQLFSPRELWNLLSSWGRPRMLASSSKGSPDRIVTDLPPDLTSPFAGAFIIAEVRR